MATNLPPPPGEIDRIFDGYLGDPEGQPIELWSTRTSIPRLLRWQISDEPELYAEAVADRLLVFPRTAMKSEEVLDRFDELDHPVEVHEELLDFLVLTLLDPVRFWTSRDYRDRDDLIPWAHVEPDYILYTPLQEPADDDSSVAADDLAWVGAREQWDPEIENPEALVALIDSGVDLEHCSLHDRIAHDASTGEVLGLNLLESGKLPRDDHLSSHGTYCAGIIAGTPNKAFDFSGGVLRNGRIVPIKAFDYHSRSRQTLVAKAIDFAASTPTPVICLPASNFSGASALKPAIARAGAKGRMLVTPAGNAPVNLKLKKLYPASFSLPANLVVGGIDDRREPPSIWGWGKETVHLSAPGATVFSTKRSDVRGSPFKGDNGTSAAAAIVAAGASLLQNAALAYRGEWLTPADLKCVLVESVHPLDPKFRDKCCAVGYLDLVHAVELVKEGFECENPPRCP